MATIESILGDRGAIAKRLGDAYEARPQQLELAHAVENAFQQGHHLIAEAGTGVGKSFAYLVPAIEYVLKTKKRVVISTHTIALQEQLIEKDIPLLRSVYPDEFSAVLVKGRGNYLCRRRLDQTRARQNMLFDNDRQMESLHAIQEWSESTYDGSLTSLPLLPDPSVWERVNAEQGNCMGKRCRFYGECHWQAAKRRMQSGQLLIVNHALFFSDLALRSAGVNYLPKYDAVIFDEAHTIEDVAGQHFGIRLSEGSVKHQLRTLYDPRRGSGILSTHGGAANAAIQCVTDLGDEVDTFFDRVAWWQETFGRANGRVQEANVIPNDLSPKLDDLAKYLREMLLKLGDDNDEAVSELTAIAARVSATSETIRVLLEQSMPDAVYWFDVPKRTPRRVGLHAAPIDIADGLRQQLFAKLPRVILTSATLATAGEATRRVPLTSSGMGYQPMSSDTVQRKQGAYLPHWTKSNAIYTVCFRLADSLPQTVIADMKAKQGLSSGADASTLLNLDAVLDSGLGECTLARPQCAQLVQEQLQHFDGEQYRLVAWSVMPNHVHAILQPIAHYELPQILHAWKSSTANRINSMIGRTGRLWQSEYYDHIIRNEEELHRQIAYVHENALRSGIQNWTWCGRQDELIAELVGNISSEHGLVAHATKQANPASGKKTKPNAVTPPNPRFAFIQKRLGIDQAQTLELGSPFDYADQATLYIENDLPDPNDNLRFLPAACEKILRYLDMTHGGAFVLFTSYRMLQDAAARLKYDIEKQLGLPMLIQGQNVPRKLLLEQFRALDNAVLFGTSSFWQGIDVQGEKLRNVIIVKLPFSVPDEPLLEAKLDAIKKSGGNPFMELQVPEAIIKLKQGFGRLIRSKTDRGIVVLLDNRVRSKRYGPLFLDSLPPCRVVDVT